MPTPPDDPTGPSGRRSPITTRADKVLRALKARGGTCPVDQLADDLALVRGLPRAEVAPALTILALRGLVEPLDDGEVARVTG